MTKRYDCIWIILFAVILCGLAVRPLSATWKQVAAFSAPATCGYFFNDRLGLVGCGNGIQNSLSFVAEIRRTTDGGSTWVKCTTPTSYGRVTSIYMADSLMGFASIMFGTSIWKTTDAGVSWQFFASAPSGDGTCVYATADALIVTMWGPGGGGTMPVGANLFTLCLLGNNSNSSNGIDFLDDRAGVVTMGPDGAGPDYPSYSYCTRDGGRTWRQGANFLEAWGVYAAKLSGKFYALPEGNIYAKNHALYCSTDSGMSWSVSPSVGLPSSCEFTGHIAGQHYSMYVQSSSESNVGLFRSDDRGKTWKNVGGPSNFRDTRFFVTGCVGNVVYAFDTLGGIWKTDDGGDGTLTSSSQAATVFLKSGHTNAYAGDTISIPLYCSTSSDLILNKGTQLTIPFTIDTDVLIPIAYASALPYLTAPDSLIREQNTIELHATSDVPIHNDDLLGSLRCVVYLTDTLQTQVDLGSAHLSSTGDACLAVTTGQGTAVIDVIGCGTTTLSNYLRTNVLHIESISPNPATDRLVIACAIKFNERIAVTIVDALGRTMLTAEPTQNEITLDVSMLPAGLYFVRAQSRDRTGAEVVASFAKK